MTPLAALEADPFLPAVERLEAEGIWGLTLPNVVMAMRGMGCHPRPMFELIPDHEGACHCGEPGWRP